MILLAGEKSMIQNDLPELENQKVVLLRAKDQAQELTNSLESLGAQVIQCPLIELVPKQEEMDKLSSSFLRVFHALIFTSVNGVKVFSDALKKNNVDPGFLKQKDVYVIGPKTRDACLTIGLFPKPLPDYYQAEDLIELIGNSLNGKKVLLITAEGARKLLPLELAKKGVEVTTLPIYKNLQPLAPDVTVDHNSLVMFTSPSTVDRFFESRFYKKQEIIAFCIGSVTAQSVKKYVTANVYTAQEATVESLVDKMIDYARGSV